MMKKYFSIRVLVVLLVLALTLTACQAKGLEDRLPRKNATSLSVSYMGYVADQIPQAVIESANANFSLMLDVLYGAEEVVLGVENVGSYSPELNASHVLYLHTEAGSMPVYLDEFQGVFSVPLVKNQKDGDLETKVRIYKSFKPSATAMAALSAALVECEPAQQPDAGAQQPGQDALEDAAATPPSLAGFTPEDDSALRGQITAEQIAAAGELVSFTDAGSNPHRGETALYYAFDETTLAGVESGRLYLVACPAQSEGKGATISAITKNETGLIVRVMFADGQPNSHNAAYIDLAAATAGSQIVFVSDADGSILYCQTYGA